MHDDDLIDLLDGLDPVGADEAPEPGSPRYHRILETAMNTTTTDTDTDTTTADRPVADASGGGRAPGGSVASPTFWRSRSSRLFVAAAAVVVLAVGAMTLRPGGTPSAEAQIIRSAADALGEVESLRVTFVDSPADGTGQRRGSAEFSGADFTIWEQYEDYESQWTVVGDTQHIVENGELTEEGPVPPEMRMTPFADASAQVLDAAVSGAVITDLGQVEVDGVTADHFRIEMTEASRAALARLTPQEQAWFELEYPQYVEAVEVLVADDLIRQITVTFDEAIGLGVSETQFFDFNEPITIVIPGS
ncbi:MAG: hypothetical protein ACE367_01370 [Acidimicrobiales bacterium]